MAKNKTKQNQGSVTAFLNAVQDEQKRTDSYAILEIMKALSGEEPKMWGESIIGFGNYHYKYESGREGDFMRIGFAPRKQNIALYLMTGANRDQHLITKLGKYKTGKSCLYINKLAEVDIDVLKEMITSSIKLMDEKYPRR